MPETFLVTGANRGIGLAVVKVLVAQGDKVFAACRKPKDASELAALQKTHPGNLDIVELDADSDASVQAAAGKVSGKAARLDALINMAGIMLRPHDAKLEDLDFQHCRDTFETNVLGPLRVAKFFLPLLRKSQGARIVNVTSGIGSLSGTDNPHFYAYGASKSALNKVSRTLALELKKENIVVVALDPGMAFGTGLHPTTRLCLAGLERWHQAGLVRAASVLDVGSGSGILSVAAGLFGAARLRAIDTDLVAVEATRQNARRNRVAVEASAGSLPVAGGPFDLVLANLVASLLVELASELADALHPGDGTPGSGGRLLASGIFVDREPEVRRAFAAAGLRVVRRDQETDWVALDVERSGA